MRYRLLQDTMVNMAVSILTGTHSLQGEGTQRTQNLFIKTCVFILTCLNFSHLQHTLLLMKYTYQDVFCTAQNSF